MAQLPQHLLQKYATRGPRYTSYPPASSFHTGIDKEKIREIWLASGSGPMTPTSMYFHIPFCRVRCLYCGCHTTSQWKEDDLRSYMGALRRETGIAAELLGGGGTIGQIAMGGGTPNTLDRSMMTDLLSTVRRHFTISEDSEISIELDPRILDLEYVDFLVDSGFNRFSLGVQDLDPRVQKIIHRVEKEEKIRAIVEKIRSRGIEAINFDLIYGLPAQTKETLLGTIDKVIAIGPSRIAVFGYAHVPWMHPHQKALEGKGLPTTQERAELVLMVNEKLIDAGYIHIGLDHFARENDELAAALRSRKLHRNFMGYTTRKGLRLAALGSSAISAVGGSYVQDDKDLGGYMKTILEEARLPWTRGFVLSKDDMVRRDLIMELFCNLYVDLTELGRRHGISAAGAFAPELEKISQMERDGLLRCDGRSIDLTPVGRLFVRNVCMVFDRYLDADAGKRVHSKTL